MADEIDAIIEEISEELKNDKSLEFLKKHRKVILNIVAVTVVGIVAYSSWYSRRNQQMAEITNALVEMLQSPTLENRVVIEGLLEDAPSELKPLLAIIKSGSKLYDFKDMEQHSDALLALTQKHGVDIVWKDLATMVVVSYRLKPMDELTKLLEPLTSHGRPFRYTAMEFLSMNYENTGNHEKAEEYLKKIIDSKDAPETLKKRVSMLLNYLKRNEEKKA